MYFKVLEYLCKVFWKFQAKLFKNTCNFLKLTGFWHAAALTMNSLSKYFQGFFLDYQNTLFPEQLFIAHSWDRVPNTLYVMKTPLYSLTHLFKICPTPLPCSLQPSPPLLFWMSYFFDCMGDRATFDVLF